MKLAFRGYKNLRSRFGSTKAEDEAKAFFDTDSWSLEIWAAVFDKENENRAHARIMNKLCATNEVKIPVKNQTIRGEKFYWHDTDNIMGGNLCFMLIRLIPILMNASRWFIDATYQVTAPFEKSGFRQSLIISVKGRD